MSSKHTRGPWNCNRASAAGRNVIVSENATVDICVLSNRDKTPSEIDANARLIAAAPELLEALIACHAELNRLIANQAGISDEDLTDIARPDINVVEDATTAIAKATGEQP